MQKFLVEFPSDEYGSSHLMRGKWVMLHCDDKIKALFNVEIVTEIQTRAMNELKVGEVEFQADDIGVILKLPDGQRIKGRFTNWSTEQNPSRWENEWCKHGHSHDIDGNVWRRKIDIERYICTIKNADNLRILMDEFASIHIEHYTSFRDSEGNVLPLMDLSGDWC